MRIALALVLVAILPTVQYYYCGDVKIDDTEECECGKDIITYKEQYQDKKGCCGQGQCEVKDGRGICKGGSVCTGYDAGKAYRTTWPCGDARVPVKTGECRCGEETLSYAQYLSLIHI